jgi:hypothetical protein
MCFNKKSYSSRESGNVFFFIILGIVLFAALSYTVVNTSDGGSTSLLTENQAKLSQGEIDAYYADMRAGLTQLQLEGCSSIDYTPPADQVAGDKSCHLFHPDGGGVVYIDFGDGFCSNGRKWADLEIGEGCDNIVYAGTSGGNRLYTTVSDMGLFSWGPSGQTANTPSYTDGLGNTNTIMALADSSSYLAASNCRALGEKWYLPARQELRDIWTNRLAIGNFDTSGGWPAGRYWSSSEADASSAYRVRFDGSGDFHNRTKSSPLSVRCVRQE